MLSDIKIWIPGASGMLGKAFVEELSKDDGEIIGTNRQTIDVSNTYDVIKFVKEHSPDCIINCTGFTNVDDAEVFRDEAWETNVDGAMNIGIASSIIESPCIHFSTDYVFDGSKQGYTESDICNPVSHYGITKHIGEEQFLNTLNKGFVVRTSWLFSEHGHNFVKTMLNLFKNKDEVNVVNDQFGCPTYAPYLVSTCIELCLKEGIEKGWPSGIWHITNSDVTSWYDFAVEIYKISRDIQLINKDVNIIPISTSELIPPRRAHRPKCSVLETKKVEACLGKAMKPWKQSLLECLKKIKEQECL